jgi:inner membrane protein
VTGQVTQKVQSSKFKVQSSSVVRVALMCGAAYASHLLLDWLGVDRNPPRGIQALWPFSDEWFISGLDVFIQTERRQFFTWTTLQTNLAAMAWETLLVLPLLGAIWLVRVKTLARLSTELPRRHHPS